MQLDARFVRAFARAPMMRQLAVARVVTQGERAVVSVAKMIDLVALMSSMLSAEARCMLAQQLRETADMLSPPHEKRALH
jgi:hypothetical protein